MVLYIVRHGQSANNAIGAAEPGDTPPGEGEPTPDPPLTPIGRRQAELTARFLAGSDPQAPGGESSFGLTHLYTSLMLRAVATAYPISVKTGIAPVAWPEVHEWGGLYRRDGQKEGLPGPGRSFFAEHFPTLSLPDWLDESGWWNRPWEDRPELVLERARIFVEQLLQRHGESEHRVAVVTHGGFFRALRRVMLGAPSGTPPFGHPDEPRPKIHNASISRFDFGADWRDGEVEAVYLNRVDHLTPDLLTPAT